MASTRNRVNSCTTIRSSGKYPDLWHLRHMEDPRSITPGSIMPVFPWLLTDDLDFEFIRHEVAAQVRLGVPYTEQEVAGAVQSAHVQAAEIAGRLAEEGGVSGLESKKIVALIAYLQRLGTDIKKPLAPAPAPDQPAAETPVSQAPEVAAAEAPAAGGVS